MIRYIALILLLIAVSVNSGCVPQELKLNPEKEVAPNKKEQAQDQPAEKEPPKRMSRKKINIAYFTTTDGVKISGMLYFPKYDKTYGTPRLPVAILLHNEGSSKESYKALAEKLYDNGIAVLAFDFRGHGGSNKTIEGEPFSRYNMEWEEILIDVDSAIAYLGKDRRIDSKNITLVGAKIGANAAIIASADYPDQVKKVVAISPALNNNGLTTDDRIARSKADIMLVATKMDEKSSEAIDILEPLVTSSVIVKKYRVGGQGTQLFTYLPESLEDILTFIKIEKQAL